MARTDAHLNRARTREIPPKLLEAYHRIRDGERSAIRTRTAREVLGASVIRVFAPGTKPCLIEQLESVDVDALPRSEFPGCFSTMSGWTADGSQDKEERVMVFPSRS